MQVSGRTIVVLATGGTIAGESESASDDVGYRSAQRGVAELLHGIPAAAGVRIQGEQVAQVDSKDMDFGVWLQLAQRCAHWLAQDEVAGIVVTHGTDTMEETAFFLHAVLAPCKPVVLTGAMRPATSASADGPGNLADAIARAAVPGAHGVCVAFAGQVIGALEVTKVHSDRVDAFASVDRGPVPPIARPDLAALPPADRWPRVEIIMSHAGADGGIVRALLAQGVAGIVVAATGNGTLHHRLEAALLQAQAQGVAVRRSSRCAQGRVVSLPGDQLAHAGGLSPVQARVALLLELMR
ncbi:MAG TPA: asparaginase [Ramlibacter sp.]|jgi:L-asparaginase